MTPTQAARHRAAPSASAPVPASVTDSPPHEGNGATAPAFLTRDQLLTAPRPNVIQDVELPGWGTLRVGEIWQGDKEEIDHLAQARIMGADGKEKTATDYRLWMPRLIAAALVNPDGSRMFPDWREQAAHLAKRFTPAQMQLLFEAAAEVNALTREAREALGKA